MRRRRDDGGMTLIEVTIASTLLLSVVFTMGEALTSNGKADAKIETSTAVQQEARLALENVTRALRTKQSVVGACIRTGFESVVSHKIFQKVGTFWSNRSLTIFQSD